MPFLVFHESVSVMTDRPNFEEAQVRVKKLSKTPTPQELLNLYALYKQATVGDAEGNRPSVFEVRARAKFDAWVKEKGVAQKEATEKYIALVLQLESKYN